MSNEHGTEFNISGDYQHQGNQVQGDKHTSYGERSVHVENSTVESINTGVQIHITPIIPPKNDPEYATWQRAKQNFIAAVRQSWIDGFLKKQFITRSITF